MSMSPDSRPATPLTHRTDFAFTSENITRRLGTYITSPDQLPVVDRAELSGKSALITGSTRGIGAATALLLADYGMHVTVNGRGNDDRGERLVELIKDRGGDAVFVPADVSSPEGAKAVVDGAVKAFGKIDVVVNNAGTTRDNIMMKMKPEEWYTVMRSNADSAFFTTQAAARQMMKNGGGMIIYNSSIGQLGIPGQANYAASKRAMEAVAEVTAQDPMYESRGVNTSIFRIGLTDTDLTSSMSSQQKQMLLDVVPSHKEFKPEEVAKCIPYLATLKESGHILTLA